MDNRVQSRLPFGIPSNFENYELTKSSKANITLFRSDRSKSSQKQVFIESRYITKNIAWKDKRKCWFPKLVLVEMNIPTVLFLLHYMQM